MSLGVGTVITEGFKYNVNYIVTDGYGPFSGSQVMTGYNAPSVFAWNPLNGHGIQVFTAFSNVICWSHAWPHHGGASSSGGGTLVVARRRRRL